MTYLILSRDILSSSIEITVVSYGIKWRHIDKNGKKLVDRLPSLLSLNSFMRMKK